MNSNSFQRAAGLLLAFSVLLLAACNKAPGEKSAGRGAGGDSGGGKAAVALSGGLTDFDYTTFAGQSGKLSQLAGQPLVLNFWGAW